MTLQQLEYIVALDVHRHFVQAAESCFVTQPTLTMQVSKLEQEIGFLLFDRNRKPLQPTPAGVRVLAKARQILREVGHLKDILNDATDSMKGSFTLGIIPTLAPYLLPRFLPSFMRQFPDLSLQIREMKTTEIISGLSDGSLDIGLLATPLNQHALREVPVFKESFLLYLSGSDLLNRKKEVTAGDIDPGKLLLLQEGHCFRDQALRFCNLSEQDLPARFEYKSGSIEALKALTDQGLGYTLVPELSVSERDSKKVKRFREPGPAREISIVIHHTFPRVNLLNELNRVIRENLPITDNQQESRIIPL